MAWTSCLIPPRAELLLLNFLIVFLVIFASGFGVDVHVILYLPIIMIIQYFFVLGIVFFLSAVTVYFRDMEQIIGLVLMAWIYATPIMYNMDYVPQKYLLYIKMNPMTAIIEIYHQVLYYHITPTMDYWITAASATLISLIVGIITFEKLSRSFAEEM